MLVVFMVLRNKRNFIEVKKKEENREREGEEINTQMLLPLLRSYAGRSDLERDKLSEIKKKDIRWDSS